MSRETDTPSSGPNGRGGAAYPSGTPPYGTPVVSEAGADAGRPAAQPEERKTETTLTTRIRINIPGSRPIPPVVVRKPVVEADVSADDTTESEPPASGPAAPTGAGEPPAEPAGTAEEKTSDWFAPRKSSPGKGSQGGGATNGASTPAASGTPGAANGAGTANGVSAPRSAGAPGGAGVTGGSRPNAGRPGGVVGSMGLPGGARSGGTNGAGLPGATGGPVAPGHGGGTGSFDVTEALNVVPLAGGPRPGTGTGAGEPRRDDLPYFSENGAGGQGGIDDQPIQNPQNLQSAQNGQNGYGGQGGPNGFGGPNGPRPGPTGPTGGPVTGDGPLAPPPVGAGPGTLPGGPGTVPGGPGTPPGAPRPGGHAAGAPGGGLSDDTAILTPQKPAPEPGPGTPGYGAAPDNVSGHTVTSGIPVVPPAAAQGTPFGPGARGDGPLPHTPPKLPEPVSQNVPPAPSAKKKKKGRNKLVLLGGGVVVLGGLAYGAGLLMNHSDVPKGTTVLGVDIGGGTRDDAVKKLDDAFGDRVNKALKLSVGGDTVSLKPDQAGLQFDTQATVRAAAESDYNPVSVIGSLFGNHRVVEPVMPVDEEKLHAELADAAGGSGSVKDGTIKFEAGKAVAVYGKAGKSIDVDKSTQAVEDAYRAQVETGTSTAVPVATTTKQPAVSNAEVDRMMKKFAQPAMSANVTVQTDAAHSIAFSPQNSLWKFLRVTAVDGKLVDDYDEAALKGLYGQTFDDVLITRANGKKTAVTVEDVYGALRLALMSKSDRSAVIETDPS
ncbi:hypothetical protein [Streptomyces sp. HUCO-GS316]|uniref:hypothetical protein n=1 Tax=Streptomyces sp. HUCO-GS316 TaxID=2692198 RepID=UPI001925C852|nr:hypothetical protein [Streptomyces sp. HUCO-GS316]